MSELGLVDEFVALQKENAELKASVAVLMKGFNKFIDGVAGFEEACNVEITDVYGDIYFHAEILNNLPTSAKAYAEEHEKMRKALEEIKFVSKDSGTDYLQTIVVIATEALKV